MPRTTKRTLCVTESVLSQSGGVSTVMLDERYTPYNRQKTRIENLCGSFTQFVPTAGLEGVLKRQGGLPELFHLEGNVVLNHGKGLFLAVRGMQGLERLSKALHLTSPDNITHMVVMTSKMGQRVQVCSHGLLETVLARHKHQVRVKGRIYEHTNSVCFSLLRFDTLPFFLPLEYRPDNNDWTVTGKGMIIIRLIWRRLTWTSEAEKACVAMCDAMTEWLRECS
jgi:hypothetical protein